LVEWMKPWDEFAKDCTYLGNTTLQIVLYLQSVYTYIPCFICQTSELQHLCVVVSSYHANQAICMINTLLCSHELSGYAQFISLFIFFGRIRICITYVLLDSVVPLIDAYRFCYQYMCYSDINRFSRRLTI
jgi:hypothetical protein